MIKVLTTTDSQKLLQQLNALLEQEARYQPEACGLRLTESACDNGLRTARLRDFEVKDLLSLIQFFGFDTETFPLAVKLLDRFLSDTKMHNPLIQDSETNDTVATLLSWLSTFSAPVQLEGQRDLQFQRQNRSEGLEKKIPSGSYGKDVVPNACSI
ncbi:Cyclin-G1 [Fukomys damarensis]|uniref:Cyclin-G1 n=1 Tax=Fukomys damarensis TaxID=885580 RepID=A0A091D6L6_FUKDA|nr:Cyclin-G1 [Fukomys damarensis]